MWCIYEPLVGEFPSEEMCKNGCGKCIYNVPDMEKPKPGEENMQDALPYFGHIDEHLHS